MVAADVEECAQRAVLAAYHQNLLAADLLRQEAPYLRQVFLAADAEPHAAEEHSAFQREDFRVGVHPPRQRARLGERAGGGGELTLHADAQTIGR